MYPKVNEKNEKNNNGTKFLPGNIRTNNIRIPKLIFMSSDNEISISIYYNDKCIIKLCMEQIQKMLEIVEQNLEKMIFFEIGINEKDYIFTQYTEHKCKELCDQILKKIKIYIVKTPKIDENEIDIA